MRHPEYDPVTLCALPEWSLQTKIPSEENTSDFKKRKQTTTKRSAMLRVIKRHNKCNSEMRPDN
jgi:hypothetical protein